MATPLETVIADARAFLGERLSTNASVRETHSHGEDTNPPRLPDAVAFVETTEEVSRLLALCHAHSVPVVAFGAGTSLEGHVTPVRGGISLDLTRMARVLEVSQADLDCRVEAGVTHRALNRHLRDQGLFFPVDPGADATLGGMCATRASGTNAVRYGTIRENVLGLTVVLADGRVIRTGGRVRKSSTGYDLTRLFIGQEGTLGIITEIQLRLHGIPEAMSAATCQFAALDGAVETVIAVMQSGIPVARIELLDEVQLQRLHRLLEVGRRWNRCRPCSSSFTARRRASPSRRRRRRRSPSGFGARGFVWATDEDERRKLWQARHDAYWASPRLPARPQGRDDGRDRADLAPRRGGAGRQAGHRRVRLHRADRRPCRRRQFPRADPGAGRRCGRRSRAPGRSTARSSPARWRWAAVAAASTAWASASANSWSASTAPRRWP